jgi:hypothetical protein
MAVLLDLLHLGFLDLFLGLRHRVLEYPRTGNVFYFRRDLLPIAACNVGRMVG